MPRPGLMPLLLLLLGLAGAAPLSKQEVTRCLEEALKDKLAQEGPREGPCMQLFQEEISKHHLGPEIETEREEQEDFRKKKRGPEAPEGERRLGQEEQHELERLEQMGEELKRAAEALGRRG
ncbi:coiled-coil domain-containing glutamate-rich protein 2 isoform X2 [Gracilinanus agilis]|uniref:coiled-coil domain-containing glutamate-rich protein 2 isoform X2 n=1 Tax=Gracilinanus agilis TaxID=191870 RepID=UPI001CFF4ABF|nr:coiled-coil domain-containing glutamate-rich protein 2 isoform X2 [Gracilinanus agilis]